MDREAEAVRVSVNCVGYVNVRDRERREAAVRHGSVR